MTTIAVTVDREKKIATFASDKQVTWGSQKIGGESKVFTKGAVTFGFAGSVRDANILLYQLDVPEMTETDKQDPAGYVVKRLIPAIRDCLRGNGSLENNKGEELSESTLIVSVLDATGYLCHDFSFFGFDRPYLAVGSGGDFALGAMAAGKTAKEAVKIASDHNYGTGPDVDETVISWT